MCEAVDMDEKSILNTINGLVDEEHRLRAAAQAGEITSDEERARLRTLEESLDQCWDLLRRRRAAQAGGELADDVQPRSVTEVEEYLQ
jgi:Protein of unknown function (DUF2630)